jgi:amino acid adenylation domain-containing protein
MNREHLQPVDFDPFSDPVAEQLADPFSQPASAPHGPGTDQTESVVTGASSGSSGVLPLTSMQRELYAAVQMGPQAQAAFNLVYSLQLAGPLDAAGLTRALALTVSRHRALTARVLPNGQGQQLDAAVPVELPLLDVSGLPPDAQTAALHDLLQEQTQEPFDVEVAPLWRAQLVRKAEQDHTLVFTVHHLVFDGWSSSVFFSDWAQAYRADSFGLVPQWAAAVDYEQYVRQQTSAAQQALEQASMDYWLAQHAVPAAPLALPLDRPRPAFKTYACAHAVHCLPDVLAADLRQQGARLGCTVFVTLLGAVQGLVARLSGASEVVVGTPMAVQTTLDEAHLVADGAQTVPLRGPVALDRPFSEHLRQTRSQVLAAQAHLHCSFGLLVRQLNLARDASRTPLVDLVFNMDRGGPLPDFGDVRLVSLQTPKRFSNAELSVNVLDDGRSVTVEVNYLSALYDAETLQRWLALLETALQRWVRDTSISLAQAFSPTEHDLAWLHGLNATAAPTGPPGGPWRIEQWFAHQSARVPEAVAVWSAGQGHTYRELDQQANGIARALLDAGVQPGDWVAVACGRGPQTLPALLGVMRSGAAYVPLDLGYPQARLEMMLEDAGVRLALCDDAPPPALAAVPALQWLPVAACSATAEAPARPLSSEDPAYLIFTSGSTGRPKGVVIPHRAVMNYLWHVAQSPGMSAADRIAAVTSMSFDMSVTELFLPMTVGASLVMMPRDEVQDGRHLAQGLVDGGVTILQAAPSIWRVLLQAGWPASVEPAGCRLRAWTGGEALSPALAERLTASCAEVWNFYGPTETTVFSTIGRIVPTETAIHVGAPIANTQVHVLDDRMQPLPVGAVGEIWIGGAGVAQGYWGRPELTAQRFVADPASPGQRMYRTGDLGRWRSDGLLECLGRSDHQVKLRGHRLELGEIETALAACGATESLAWLHEAPGAEPVLAVCVVHADGQPSRLKELREQLRSRLPAIMVPTHWAAVAAMPLLPNGKVNRHALPVPLSLLHDDIEPAELTPEQARVARIWAKALGLGEGTRLHTHDNFFDLGGHSLLATQVSVEMEAALGWRVGVPRLVMESLGQLAKEGEPLVTKPAAGSSRNALVGWLSRWGVGPRGPRGQAR